MDVTRFGIDDMRADCQSNNAGCIDGFERVDEKHVDVLAVKVSDDS